MGGHLVFGHVDGQAEIVERKDRGRRRARFDPSRAPEELAPFIAQKGLRSALDGTFAHASMARQHANEFDVLLIRHSLEVTTWGERKAGVQGQLS